eukprot:7850165-Alexandrium_andersonii.AAC.1
MCLWRKKCKPARGEITVCTVCALRCLDLRHRSIVNLLLEVDLAARTIWPHCIPSTDARGPRKSEERQRTQSSPASARRPTR